MSDQILLVSIQLVLTASVFIAGFLSLRQHQLLNIAHAPPPIEQRTRVNENNIRVSSIVAYVHMNEMREARCLMNSTQYAELFRSI
jgi:hypothetical protein